MSDLKPGDKAYVTIPVEIDVVLDSGNVLVSPMGNNVAVEQFWVEKENVTPYTKD